jgi:spermidine synthase
MLNPIQMEILDAILVDVTEPLRSLKPEEALDSAEVHAKAKSI